MFGLSKVEIGTVIIITVSVLAGLFYFVYLQSILQDMEDWIDRKDTVEEARSAAVDEIKKLKASAMSELQAATSEREKILGEITSEREAILEEITSTRKFDQTDCHMVDSGKQGGRLACPVGEYVAGAKNRTGTNDKLDFILCCKP